MSILQNKPLKRFFKKSQGSLKTLLFLSLLLVISSCGGGGSDNPTPPTNDNPLTSLSVSGISLSPAFSPSVNSYTATVPFSTISITLQASVISGASVTANGATFNGSGSFDLAVGSNAFSIVVTNSGTSQTYTITITREGASTDALLSELVISSGSLSPVFNSQTFTYGSSVGNETTSITVTPTSSDSNASIAVNGVVVTSGSASGAIALTVGDNPIDIIVTAEGGSTSQTYTTTVSRLAPLSNDANLSSLNLSVGSLDPAFNAATLTYSASVSFTTTSITVTPVLSDTNASVTVNGTLTDSGTASDSINLDEGDNTITLVVLAEDDTTTQTYIVTVTRQAAAAFAQQAYIKASNTGDDEFGYSVSLDGDTLAVGARFEASSSTGIGGDETNNDIVSGAVYVFTRIANSWTQQAYIKASNAGAGDQFGFSVTLSGDTLAVGAWGEASTSTGIGGDESNNDADGSGAVYVFTRSASSWTQQAYIKASNTALFDFFGWSVALDGNTLAVGAYRERSNSTGIGGDETNNDANGSGAVYVFTRSGNTWAQQAYIKASNSFGGGPNGSGDNFGFSIALSGNTLAVGAIREASNATGIGGNEFNNDAFASGAVYVFARSGSNWAQQAYIKASNTEEFDTFGDSVALDGDTLVVGARNEDSNSTGIGGDESNNDADDSGAVYVFTRSASSWIQQAYIKPSNTGQLDSFGFSVALNGDTLAVGAYNEDSGATGIGGDESNDTGNLNSGAVYLFTLSGSSWTQQAYIKASNTDADDRFGIRVALSDGTLAVGASGEGSNSTGIDGGQGDDSIDDAGATYVFEIPPNG